MRIIRRAWLIGLVAISTFSYAHDSYKQVRITVPDATMLEKILDAGLDPEGVSGKIGGAMEFVASDFDLQMLRQLGIQYQVIIHDLTDHYLSQNTGAGQGPEGFGYGSMGGFYTLAEVIQQLDSMRLQYPSLITGKDSIGRTEQNRPVYAMRIGSFRSDGKPEVLYTSLHHAREPQGMMSVLYYMWWLLQNYGTHPEATYLVDNRQMYFIPVVNPDGYDYNRQSSPSGGGMWRKNRRPNTGGSFGVDLNRNYGPFYMWNAPNGGSSTSPSSDTYRGTEPFSEPETRAVDAFMRSRNIRTCFNYHTYSNLLIYPFGYLSRESTDSLLYREWAFDMTGENRYTSGTDQQTVNYSTRGNSDDYMYGDSTKYRTYAMTPEVGSTGFWPSRQEIFPLAIENVHPNKLLAYYAGHYVTVTGSSLQDGNNDGYLNRGDSFSLTVRMRNKGVGGGNAIAVQALSSVSSIQFTGQVIQSVSVAPRQEFTLAFTGTVAPNSREGIPVQFLIRVSDSDGFERTDTLSYFIGTPEVLLSDNAGNGTGRWNTGTGWGLTTNAYSAPYAFTDSPSGNYSANANNSLTLNSQLNLAGYDFAELRYFTKWALEPTWDFATVEVSTNNGTTWSSLRSQLSRQGSARSGSAQPAGSWGYDGFTPGLAWIEQNIDLSNYVNRNIRLRFRVAADGGDQRDGFYVDDIRVMAYSTSDPPVLDTSIVVTPSALVFSGQTGSVFADSIRIRNRTASAITITLSDSLTTSAERPASKILGGGNLSIASLIQKLRPAFAAANIDGEALRARYAERSDNPEVYTTVITDERGENGAGSADVYRVRYQFRTSVLGSFHDFQVVMADIPDTNVLVAISLDTDQDFATGAFPTPLGIGPTTRDIGSEREILLDGSGLLADSLLGIGRIPAGAVIDATVDTLRILGTPFLLTIRRDSVLTISTESILGGVNANTINDPDGKMNLGASAIRLSPGANPLPDFAPAIGHGNIGGETGVSWLSQIPRSIVVPANDSVNVAVRALAAKTAGTYRGAVLLKSPGRQTQMVPVTMSVSNPAAPIIQVTPVLLSDTLVVGDSSSHFITIRNLGAGTLNFAAVDSARNTWLSLAPIAGVVDPGLSSILTLRLNSTGLRTDTTYRAQIAILNNDPVSNLVPVGVNLHVRRVTSVHSEGELPSAFRLYQNYPNPFNPETRISFDLPETTPVSLRIFSILGQEIATVLNGTLEAGQHSVVVGKERHNLASGVYLYTLHAGQFIATRKFVLLK